MTVSDLHNSSSSVIVSLCLNVIFPDHTHSLFAIFTSIFVLIISNEKVIQIIELIKMEYLYCILHMYIEHVGEIIVLCSNGVYNLSLMYFFGMAHSSGI